MGAVVAAVSQGPITGSTHIPPRLWLDANLAADQGGRLALADKKLTFGALRWSLQNHGRAEQDFVLWAADLGYRAGMEARHARS